MSARTTTVGGWTIRRQAGIAGQVSYTAGRGDESVEFVGSVYGAPGPVVMVLGSGTQTFVTEPGRFGSKFDHSWVAAFVAGLSAVPLRRDHARLERLGGTA